MIKHVVMLKFLESGDGRTKKENLVLAAEMLGTLKDKVSVVKSFSVGINGLESTRAFDLCLIAEFDNWDSLSEYADHPEHLKVLEFINKVREASHSCDYEF